jgi:hypothetical protein
MLIKGESLNSDLPPKSSRPLFEARKLLDFLKGDWAIQAFTLHDILQVSGHGDAVQVGRVDSESGGDVSAISRAMCGDSKI